MHWVLYASNHPAGAVFLIDPEEERRLPKPLPFSPFAPAPELAQKFTTEQKAEAHARAIAGETGIHCMTFAVDAPI